eukprot:937268-Prymnesium_polylepis.1
MRIPTIATPPATASARASLPGKGAYLPQGSLRLSPYSLTHHYQNCLKSRHFQQHRWENKGTAAAVSPLVLTAVGLRCCQKPECCLIRLVGFQLLA